MSKKSRKVKGKYHHQRKTVQGIATPQYPGSTAVATEKISLPEPIVDRHQYVIPELKRIAIIAGAMFLILIVLAFIL